MRENKIKMWTVVDSGQLFFKHKGVQVYSVQLVFSLLQ